MVSGRLLRKEIAGAIQEGAQAYLARQYTTIAIVGVIVVVVLIVLMAGGVWTYSSRRAAGVRDTLRLVKDTSQDTATTTKVKTALLLAMISLTTFCLIIAKYYFVKL